VVWFKEIEEKTGQRTKKTAKESWVSGGVSCKPSLERGKSDQRKNMRVLEKVGGSGRGREGGE